MTYDSHIQFRTRRHVQLLATSRGPCQKQHLRVEHTGNKLRIASVFVTSLRQTIFDRIAKEYRTHHNIEQKSDRSQLPALLQKLNKARWISRVLTSLCFAELHLYSERNQYRTSTFCIHRIWNKMAGFWPESLCNFPDGWPLIPLLGGNNLGSNATSYCITRLWTNGWILASSPVWLFDCQQSIFSIHPVHAFVLNTWPSNCVSEKGKMPLIRPLYMHFIVHRDFSHK